MLCFCVVKACLHTQLDSVCQHQGAAPHCVEFSIKCYDVRTEMNARTSAIWINCHLDKLKFQKCISEMFCFLSSCPPSQIKPRTASSLPFSLKQGDFFELSLSVYKHMLTLFQIVDISMLHTSMVVRGQLDVCLSDAFRPKPANTISGCLCYIISETNLTASLEVI